MRFSIFVIILALLLTGAPDGRAEKIEWSESKNLKTKTIYDAGGNIIYQAHWDRDTGKMVGTPLDLRPKPKKPARPKKSATRSDPADPEAKVLEARPDPEVRFSTRAGKLVIVADSLIRVRINTELHSGRHRRGKGFEYQLLDPIEHEGRTLLGKWAKGKGQVLFARKRGMFGRSGRMELDFGSVTLAGGEKVRLVMNKASSEANKMTATAAGTSAGGALLLGPIGLAGGVFIKGRDVHIPKGSVTYLAVAEDVLVGE